MSCAQPLGQASPSWGRPVSLALHAGASHSTRTKPLPSWTITRPTLPAGFPWDFTGLSDLLRHTRRMYSKADLKKLRGWAFWWGEEKALEWLKADKRKELEP